MTGELDVRLVVRVMVGCDVGQTCNIWFEYRYVNRKKKTYIKESG